MEIQLSKDQIALIDDEDFALISEFNWRAQQNQDGRWYAMAWNSYPNFLLMHRYVMAANDGEWIDHRNGNGLDNRKENLRVCTPSENQARKGPQGITSLFKGVHWESARGKWKAVVTKDGKSHFLGRYDNEVEAAEAYDGAAKELFGEFAYTNFG
jgi:HNH endonuclease